jgi:hypothetical protein
MMNILGNLGAGGIGSIINGVGRIADDLITTDKERLEIALKEKELDTQILSKVHETNIAEAQHRTLFVAGWRPFIGWVSGLALFYTFLIQPIFLWINSIYNLTSTPPPQLNDDLLFNIVLAMLGIAGLRTYEKQKGLTR